MPAGHLSTMLTAFSAVTAGRLSKLEKIPGHSLGHIIQFSKATSSAGAPSTSVMVTPLPPGQTYQARVFECLAGYKPFCIRLAATSAILLGGRLGLSPKGHDYQYSTSSSAGHFLSSRPSSALLDKQEKAANSKQAVSESQKATTVSGSSGFQALRCRAVLHD